MAGSLNVWQQSDVLHPAFWTKIFSEDKSQGNFWQQGLVDVAKPNTVYEASSKGKPGKAWKFRSIGVYAARNTSINKE